MQITGDITMDTARRVLDSGLKAIAQGECTFEFGAVGRMDSSAVSVMLCWKRACQRQGMKAEFRDVPEEARTLARLYGIGGLLG